MPSLSRAAHYRVLPERAMRMARTSHPQQKFGWAGQGVASPTLLPLLGAHFFQGGHPDVQRIAQRTGFTAGQRHAGKVGFDMERHIVW